MPPTRPTRLLLAGGLLTIGAAVTACGSSGTTATDTTTSAISTAVAKPATPIIALAAGFSSYRPTTHICAPAAAWWAPKGTGIDVTVTAKPVIQLSVAADLRNSDALPPTGTGQIGEGDLSAVIHVAAPASQVIDVTVTGAGNSGTPVTCDVQRLH